MKRILIVSLLSLVIVSCASQQVTVASIPTNTSQPTSTNTPTSTSTSVVTATGVLMPDGLIMLSSNHFRFSMWDVSFSLPENWDVNNKLYMSPVGTGSTLQPGRELYIFYRSNVSSTDSNKEYPRIGILFEAIPSDVDVKTYSEEVLARGHGADVVINETLDAKKLGLSVNTAIAYKTSFISESVEYTQYMIYVIYQTTGIEIIMDSQTETFSGFESEFLYFLKSLIFE